MLPHVTDALAGNPTEKLILELSVQKLPHRATISFVQLYGRVVDQNRKRRFCLAQVAQKRTAFLEKLRHVVQVDHRHDKLRLKQRHVARAFVLRHELIERLGVERVERSFFGGFV